MFTQFFGNYLLNKQLVSPEHLCEAMQQLSTTRLKLGVLAINAGLLTAEQVDIVHDEQQRVDKRIGDIMVDMGFADSEQIEELFKTQPKGHLLLGQALVDNGYMTTAQFERALNSYKAENSLSDTDLSNSNEEAIRKMIKRFYNFNDTDSSRYMTSYLTLLFKNIIRFIGDDFTPLEPDMSAIKSVIENCVIQRIKGGLSAITLISADNNAEIEFASRFAKEQLSDNDEYTQACISEFLNLHNGLFAVNLSNDEGIELLLEPQEIYNNIKFEELINPVTIPVSFSMGLINFVIIL